MINQKVEYQLLMINMIRIKMPNMLWLKVLQRLSMCKGKTKTKTKSRQIQKKIMEIKTKVTGKITTKVRAKIKKKARAKVKVKRIKVRLKSPKINLINFQSKAIRMKNKEKESLIKMYVWLNQQ